LISGPEVACREHEGPHPEAPDGIDLRRAVAKPPVLGQGRKHLAAAELEPLDVAHVLVASAEHLVMCPDSPPTAAQSPRHLMATEAAVDEELKRLLGG
jgi:hypothetical protein